MKKTAIFLAVAAIAFLTACTTEQPPAADSPEPPAHIGTFVSEYGSMTFNGDGESVIIDFQSELADATGLPVGAADGQYVFTLFLRRTVHNRKNLCSTGGDSGTGKTVLYEMLEDLRLTDEYKAIKLFK